MSAQGAEKMNAENLTIRIDSELYEELRLSAESAGLSVQDQLIFVLREGLSYDNIPEEETEEEKAYLIQEAERRARNAKKENAVPLDDFLAEFGFPGTKET